MFIIYEPTTNKVVCWAEEGQDALYPSPGPGQVESRIDCTVEEFEHACRQSSGEWEKIGVGPLYLHDTVEAATESTKTSKKGVKIGHKAVECDPEVDPEGIADAIERKRKSQGKRLDAPITLEELREAEK